VYIHCLCVQGNRFRFYSGSLWICLETACISVICVFWDYRFRPYGGSLWKRPKVSKGLYPLHTGPRWCSDCPSSGIAPGVAATGHPWPGAANSASCLVPPSAMPKLGLLETGPRDRPQDLHRICRSCRRLRSPRGRARRNRPPRSMPMKAVRALSQPSAAPTLDFRCTQNPCLVPLLWELACLRRH
jgi:hypothetical protein